GDCSSCGQQGVYSQCDGGKNTWWNKSYHFKNVNPPIIKGSFRPDKIDIEILRDIIDILMSRASFELMKSGKSTNSNEAANRAITARVPKNVRWSRNGTSRVFGTIHTLNNGPGVSMCKKLNAINIPIAGRISNFFKRIQKKALYKSSWQKRDSVKAQRVKRRKSQMSDFYNGRGKRQRSDYKKYNVPTLKRNNDHTYQQVEIKQK
ncbi:unnamed protein product, partial [Owenia fusiformis]